MPSHLRPVALTETAAIGGIGVGRETNGPERQERYSATNMHNQMIPRKCQ